MSGGERRPWLSCRVSPTLRRLCAKVVMIRTELYSSLENLSFLSQISSEISNSTYWILGQLVGFSLRLCLSFLLLLLY